MKLFLTILLGIFLASCNTSKNYLERKDEDKALQDAVKRVTKNPDDENALKAIPLLYKSIQEDQLAKIKTLSGSRELSRWDKILDSYNDLQQAYNIIINAPNAFKILTPVSYSTNLLETKQQAAEDYYASGLSYLAKPGRDNAKKAYNAFKKTSKYVDTYKDSRLKMDEAFENAVVDVVINPVQDNSFFFNSGWGNTGYNYSNEYFQQTLVRELGYNDKRYAARFYTDWEARRANIKPDWVIDLRLRDMDIPQPYRNTYTRSASKQVEVGRDTSGRAVYRTVYATVQVTRMSFTARADMEVTVRDLASGKNVSYNSFREDFRWEQENGSYSGDSRALSSYDWSIINNNSYYNTPQKEDILNELYRKIYPQVKNSISYAADW